MKAIVVRQPWATLIALGIKTIETRPAPPNGPMRPDGVKGLPGLPLERGERIAIVAGVHDRIPMPTLRVRPSRQYGPFSVERDSRDGYLLRGGSLAWPYRLPLGFVVCTVRVDDALPIVGDRRWLPGPYLLNAIGGLGRRVLGVFDEDGYGICATNGTAGRHPWVREHPGIDAATGQLPLGDFTPGRWGWMLSDPQPCDPVPCKGRQGVFELPADVAREVLVPGMGGEG